MKHHPIPPAPADGEDPRLVRLAAQLDNIDTRLANFTALSGRVEAHETAITRLAQALTTLRELTTADGEDGEVDQGDGTGGDGGASAVRDWMTVTDPALAVTWLGELTVWVGRVWDRYPPGLHGCWSWHPPVVAELLAVQASWTAATGPDATPDALAAWHDRWRPGAAARITKQLAACDRAGPGMHIDATATRHHIDPAVCDELAAWWATTHADDPTQPAPGLTKETHR